MLTAIQPTIHVRNDRRDPTRTLHLRNSFAAQMGKRFREVRGVIRKTIVTDDCFGLQNLRVVTQQLTSPGRRAFDYPRTSDKVESFMEWLKEQERQGILQVSRFERVGASVESAWTNMYIQDSYKRGVMRARYELNKAGFDVPPIAETGGVQASMSTPFHADRVGLLYTRTFNGLKGITAAMDLQLSQVLAQGMADGENPRTLARLLTRTITGPVGNLGLTDTLGRFIPAERRAKLLARTEIIRAHHQAMIQEYKNWEVDEVQVMAEFVTAGFGVCPICADIESGNPYTLKAAENLIPAHPNCRCVILPILKEV